MIALRCDVVQPTSPDVICSGYLPFNISLRSSSRPSYPDIKFLCLKGKKEHSIKSLAVSWGYNNPCYVKDRSLGIGHNRYAVDQFPDHSDSLNEFDATTKYWEEYYSIAEQYPDNVILVDAPRFFSDIQYSTDVLSYVNLNVGDKTYLPVDFDSWNISTTLHGGLGNNLFQM